MNRLLEDPYFQNDLDQAIAASICETVKKFLPCKAEGLNFILKCYGMNFRYNFTRGGADINPARINVKTDEKGVVTDIYCG